MLDPVILDLSRPRRDHPSGNDPCGSQIPLLAQIGADHAYVEILRFDTTKPALQRTNRYVDGDGLMLVGWHPRTDRAGIGALLPEEGPDPDPLPPREMESVSADKTLDGVLVPTASCRRAILDPAPGHGQETDPRRYE